jgi:hypothetical protein
MYALTLVPVGIEASSAQERDAFVVAPRLMHVAGYLFQQGGSENSHAGFA